MERKNLKRKIAQVSEGMLATATDLVLAELYLHARLLEPGKATSPAGIWKAYYESQTDLQEFNYQTLKRAFLYLKKKGLIEVVKEEMITLPKITKQGLERLSEVFPTYHEKRSWDGRIHFVTYDIAEKRRDDRDRLRRYLEKIGCGMLQNSVWITPYNPRDILRDFIEERGLEGAVIISNVGKDGSIGRTTLKELVASVYKIPEINEDYRDFLSRFKEAKQKDITPSQVAFKFFAILDKDPQLPFELLTTDWKGDEAYELFCKLTGKTQLEEVWEEEIDKLDSRS